MSCPYWRGFDGPGAQCTRNCRGFQCRHREESAEHCRHGVRWERRCFVCQPVGAAQPARCPWDDWRPSRDIA